MSESPPNKKYPVKTTVGVGLLLLWLFRGKGGFGIDRGKSLGMADLGLMPQDLQNMLSYDGGVPSNILRLVLTPNGLSKSPQGPGQGVKLEDVAKHASWFQKGKLLLEIHIRGDTKQGDFTQLQDKLLRLGIIFATS